MEELQRNSLLVVIWNKVEMKWHDFSLNTQCFDSARARNAGHSCKEAIFSIQPFIWFNGGLKATRLILLTNSQVYEWRSNLNCLSRLTPNEPIRILHCYLSVLATCLARLSISSCLGLNVLWVTVLRDKQTIRLARTTNAVSLLVHNLKQGLPQSSSQEDNEKYTPL